MPEIRPDAVFPGLRIRLRLSLVLLAVSFFPSVSFASAQPQTHRLVHGGLEVEVETDSSRLESEFGPRFDRTARLTSLRFRGVEWLEARGMPDEYGLEGNGVLGWGSNEATDPFVKIGVGRLARDEAGPYRFWKPYRVLERFPVRVEATPERVAVEQEGGTGRGDAYRLVKSYLLPSETSLEIAYDLTNTGRVPFSFEHYNHHFLAPDDGSFAGHTVEVAPDSGAAPPPAWSRDHLGVRLTGKPTPKHSAYWGWDFPSLQPQGFTVHRGTGSRLTLAPSRPVRRFAIWSDGAALCPEVFSGATLQPGETVRWTARYRFEAGAPSRPPGSR